MNNLDFDPTKAQMKGALPLLQAGNREQKDFGEWDETIDLHQYWFVLVKQKWNIIALTILMPVLAALVVFSIKPVYRSTATLRIESQAPNIVSIDEVSPNSRNEKYYTTEHQILQSRELALKVIQKLSLATQPGFFPKKREFGFNIDWPTWMVPFWQDKPEAVSEEALLYALVKLFSARLSIKPVPRSQLVEIIFEAYDAQLAAVIANTLCQTYIELDQEARIQMTLAALGALTERQESLHEKLEASEIALQAFRDSKNLLDIQGVQTLAAKQLDELAGELVKVGIQLAAAEAIHKQVTTLQNKSLSSLPAVLKDPLIQTLNVKEVEIRSNILALQKSYGPQHPRMIQAITELKDIRNSLVKQIYKIVAGVTSEYEVVKASYTVLANKMELAKQVMRQINRDESQLRVLEREVVANRNLYERFINRIKETSATENIQFAHARLVDPAIASHDPYRPKQERLIFIGAPIGFFLSIIWAFLREYFDRTLKSVGDVEERLHLPVVGFLPQLELHQNSSGKPTNPLRHFLDDPRSIFAEAVRSIRTSVLFSSLDTPHKIILVTCSEAGEGKSTVAMNLGFALGDIKKVLLVDGDMRQPSLAKASGLDETAKGLSQLAAGMNQLAECIHTIKHTNLSVLPAGIIPPNPLDLLSSKRFSAILEELTKSFDHIIIDSPPVLAVSDAQVLAKRASDVLYIVRADSTTYKLAQRGIKRLGGAQIGVVLNRVNLTRQSEEYSMRKYGVEYDQPEPLPKNKTSSPEGISG